MLTHEDLKKVLNTDWKELVIPTNAKRVIVTIPCNITGDDVIYTDCTGKKHKDNGFLFYNPTDKRTQFLRADGGIIIGYDGDCPEGINGEMILRSEAVKRYLKSNPDALKNKKNILKTLDYFSKKIFRHGKDVTSWDDNAIVDMWTSDVEWLAVNFDEKDIFDSKGKLKNVISATKKSSVYDAIYFGPNITIEGIGTTGENGSWALRKSGCFNFVDGNVFNFAYKRISKRKIKIVNKDLIYRSKNLGR